MRLSRIALLLGVATLCAGAAAFAAPSAKAGLLGCGLSSQPFAAVDGDLTSYYAMYNGGFESRAYGWALSRGASVVSGNEPWSVEGGSHALSLPSGSSAIGPRTCISLLSPTVRMFANDAGGTDRGLRVTIEYRSLLGWLLGISSYTTLAPSDYRAWSPTQRLDVPLSLLSGVPLLTASFQMQLTPIGSGSAWQVDDVYVDPFLHGM